MKGVLPERADVWALGARSLSLPRFVRRTGRDGERLMQKRKAGCQLKDEGRGFFSYSFLF